MRIIIMIFFSVIYFNMYSQDDVCSFPDSLFDDSGYVEEPYYWAEKLPEYPGGLKKIKRDAIIKLPYQYTDSLTKNIVYMYFIVDTNCNISDVKILRGINPMLDSIAIKHAKEIQFKRPAYHKNKKVRFRYAYSVTFKSL